MFGRLALIIAVIAAVVVTTPVSPVQISYVYSDSMEPTIGKNDGYFIVSDETIEQRDIIVFWSSERDEYVTHRVVGRSSAGLLTQGDNNEVTDQAAGYSHVQRDDVVGTVLTFNEEPITIPGLGGLVEQITTNRLVVAGLAVVLIVGSALYNSRTHRSRANRSLVEVSDVLHPLFAVALLGGIGFLLIGASSHELTYVAVDGTIGGPNTLTVGEATTETLLISSPSVPFTHRMVGTDGMTITNRSENASAVTAQVFIPGPTERGAYTTSITVYRYPAVLPKQTVQTLHVIHPAVAASSTVGLMFAPFFVLYALLLDGKQPLRASRTKWRTRLGGRSR